MVRSGIWQHYKGNKYLVLGTARHTESDEELVVYLPLYEHSNGGLPLQCRPVEMWTEVVDMPEYRYSGPRFVYIGEKLLTR